MNSACTNQEDLYDPEMPEPCSQLLLKQRKKEGHRNDFAVTDPQMWNDLPLVAYITTLQVNIPDGNDARW